MKATVSKQETLVYALAAAGVVIVVLLGTVIYLIGAKDDTDFSNVPAATGVGTEQQTAPPLTEEQINQSSGELPSGHPGVGGAPGASTGGAPAGGTVPAEGEEAPADDKSKAAK